MSTLRLAVVDDEEIVCRRVSQALAKEELAIEAFIIGRSFLERMMQQPFDIVLLDMRLPDMDGLEILSRIKALHPATEVIIITGHQSVESAIEAIRRGAFHYIAKPVNLAEIRLLVNSAREKIAMRHENQRLREALKGESGLTAIVGNRVWVWLITALGGYGVIWLAGVYAGFVQLPHHAFPLAISIRKVSIPAPRLGGKYWMIVGHLRAAKPWPATLILSKPLS